MSAGSIGRLEALIGSSVPVLGNPGFAPLSVVAGSAIPEPVTAIAVLPVGLFILVRKRRR